jgi:hypothetical protein
VTHPEADEASKDRMSDDTVTKVPWWTLSDVDLAEAIQAHTPRITAVLDTNVMLDVYACHDILDAHEKAVERFTQAPELHTSLGDLDILRDPKIQFRLLRARESLFLAMHLHKTRATTFSLRGEFETKLKDLAPLEPAGTDVRRPLYTGTFVNFVYDALFFDWNASMVADSHAGHAADSALLRFAKVGNLPFITNEGRKTDGSIDWDAKKIPARAKALGVRACSPREFYGNIDEAGERNDFLDRYKTAAPKYLDSRPDAQSRHIWEQLLRRTLNHYSLILCGPGTPDVREGFVEVPVRVG